LRRLIKGYRFDEGSRFDLSFSDTAKARLNTNDPATPGVSLKLIGLGLTYSEDDDIFAVSGTLNPKGVKKWTGFQEDTVKPDGTVTRFRLVLKGATEERWWAGSSWDIATDLSLHWNTAQEVNDNISSLVLESHDIAIKINLQTDVGLTSKETPLVLGFKLLGEFLVEWYEDLIYDTIVRELNDSLLATTDFDAEVVDTTSSINLATTYKMDNVGYNFVDVIAVYNLTTDPEMFINLAASYAPGALRQDGFSYDPGIITLASSVASGDIIRVIMKYTPEIAVQTDQDFYEVERFPSLVIEEIAVASVGDGGDTRDNAGGSGDTIKNFGAGTAVELPPARQTTYRLGYSIFASSQRDLTRLLSALEEWKANHVSLQTYALDFKVRLDNITETRQRSDANLSDVSSASGAFQVRSVPFYLRPAVDKTLSTSLNISVEPT